MKRITFTDDSVARIARSSRGSGHAVICNMAGMVYCMLIGTSTLTGKPGLTMAEFFCRTFFKEGLGDGVHIGCWSAQWRKDSTYTSWHSTVVRTLEWFENLCKLAVSGEEVEVPGLPDSQTFHRPNGNHCIHEYSPRFLKSDKPEHARLVATATIILAEIEDRGIEDLANDFKPPQINDLPEGWKRPILQDPFTDDTDAE